MQLINFKKLDSDNYDVITLTFFGWRQVASQSRPGEVSFTENIHTGQRQPSWCTRGTETRRDPSVNSVEDVPMGPWSLPPGGSCDSCPHRFFFVGNGGGDMGVEGNTVTTLL